MGKRPSLQSPGRLSLLPRGSAVLAARTPRRTVAQLYELLAFGLYAAGGTRCETARPPVWSSHGNAQSS